MIAADQISHHYETDAPFWPCWLFYAEDAIEIVGVLYWNEEPVLPDGDHELEQAPVGWVVHVLADGNSTMAVGDSDPHVAIKTAVSEISARGQVLGVDEQTSRERLLWRPLPNSDADRADIAVGVLS